MRDWFKRYRFLLSVLLVLFVALVILFNAKVPNRHPKAHTILSGMIYPFQWFGQFAKHSVGGVVGSYFQLVNLKKQNEELQQQNLALQEEVNAYLEESIQFHRLKLQLEASEKNPDKKIFAEVIGESFDNLHRVLHLNRGSEHGIQKNFAVILSEGVIGRIQTVTPFESTVMLILDHRSRFPVIIQRSRARGMVYGSSNHLDLQRISVRTDIQVGDRVVTSGLTGLFPKGILVGTVESIEHKDQDLFQSAKLKPAVDFDKIEAVFVIIKSEPQSEAP